MTDVGLPPHWLGLLDALGVLLAFGGWLLLVDDRWHRVRAAGTVAGTVLLVFTAAGVLQRLSAAAFILSAPTARASVTIEPGVAVVLLVAGLAAAAYAAAHEGVRDEDRVEQEPEPAYVAPARVWSSTEVLGDAPERPSRAPRLPRVERVRVPSRGVAVPLLALAVGLGLPVLPYGALNGVLGTGHVRVAQVASHVLAGLIAGGALAAAALWLDVWERALVLGAFALLAAGVAVGAGFPRTVTNGYWTFGAAGVAAGLVAPAVVRALRRMDPPGRLALLAGTAVAVALLAGAAFAQAHAVFAGGWTSY